MDALRRKNTLGSVKGKNERSCHKIGEQAVSRKGETIKGETILEKNHKGMVERLNLLMGSGACHGIKIFSEPL